MSTKNVNENSLDSADTTENLSDSLDEIDIHSDIVNDFGTEISNAKFLARNAILYVAIGFFVLFFGHAPFRSLLPALRPQSGPIFVAINFFAYAIGSLVHPQLLIKRRRLCFAFGAFAHAQWIAVLQIPTVEGNLGYVALSAISSIINGFGAGLLWSTEGGWMASYCQMDKQSQTSNKTGIFLFFYGASGFIGNVIAAITLYFLSTDAIVNVVWALFSISVLGGFILLLTPAKFLYEQVGRKVVRAAPNNETKTSLAAISSGVSKRFHALAETNETSETSGAKRWVTIKALFCETIFARSIPAICALSSVSVFSWVAIPTLCSAAYSNTEVSVNGNSVKSGAFIVPALFAIYAMANAIGAPTSSILHRHMSIRNVFSLCSLVLVVPTMVYFMFLHPLVPINNTIYGLGVASFIFGIVVGTFNNCLYALYASTITLDAAKKTSLPPENQPLLSAEAYCMHGFLYCVFYTVFSTMVAFVPLMWIALIVALMAILSAVSFLKR